MENSSAAPALIRVDGKTIPQAYLHRISLTPKQRIFLIKREGKWCPFLWEEFHAKVRGVFASLRNFGIAPGDRVCILSQSSPEWNICDIAILLTGGVTVPVYHSSNVEDIAFLLQHSGAKLIFAEDEAQCKKLAQAFHENKISIPVVLLSDAKLEIDSLTILPYAKFSTAPDDPTLDDQIYKSAHVAHPSSTATIVYTSGTTGKPKGVLLTHENILSELRALIDKIHLTSDDVTLTFLPFAHIMGRIESLVGILIGWTLGFAESINAVSLNIMELKPTILVSVPRIYEKIYSKILNEVEGGSQAKKKIFRWAVDVGRQYVRAVTEKEPVSISLQIKHQVADKLVLSKVREKMGGRIRLTISGGAPLARELCEFFHACGIQILEAYGLTETTAAVCANMPGETRFGTVGKPMAGTEFRIAADGEILVRGPVVFREYYNNPEATREAVSSDGWFSTGDIGEIDDRGYLRITDRKKELIVTSGGKNIAPQKLENLLKQIRFVSNAMVYGDKQKYLVALVTLNEPEVSKWAKAHDIAFADFPELSQNDKLHSLLEGEMKIATSGLASYESIKRFKILPHDFTIESGELTPSLKVKRKVCVQRHKQYLDELYA